jgi:hypothetical protein
VCIVRKGRQWSLHMWVGVGAEFRDLARLGLIFNCSLQFLHSGFVYPARDNLLEVLDLAVANGSLSLFVEGGNVLKSIYYSELLRIERR